MQKQTSKNKNNDDNDDDDDNRYEVLLENLPERIFYKDRNSVYVSCNSNYAQDLKISPDEIVGKTDYDFYPKEMAEKYRADDRKVIETGTTIKIDEKYILQNRQENIVRTVKMPVRDKGGNITGVMGVFWEISDRKTMEEALKRVEAKYQTVVENVSDFIFMLDESCRILSVNKAAAQVLGRRPEEIIGRSVFDLFPSDLASRYSANAKKVFQSGQTLNTDSVMTVGDNNKKVWISTTLNPVRSSSGQVTSVIGVSRDITERKQMEEELHGMHYALETRVQKRTAELVKSNKALQAEVSERKRAEELLRQSEEKYRILVDNSQDGVFIIQDGKIQFVNGAGARIGGYKTEEVLGRNFQDFVAPEDLERVLDRYRKIWEGEHVVNEYEFHLLHKDGRTRILVNATAGAVSYHGKVAIIGTVKDITIKKRLEAQMLRAQKLESIGNLSERVAHDMNNVLSPIMISLYMLKERFTDSESQQLLDILESSAKRGADLVKQIRSFTLGVEGEHKAFQVAPLISEIGQIVRKTFPRNIEVQTDVSEGVWAISGDTSQLHQVLMNLCVNARDAMILDGGILNISAENTLIDADLTTNTSSDADAKPGPYIVITVADTGVGIPPELIDRIFEPFFTTKHPGKGTGLGLSIVLSIVKNHGGFINVSSEVGKGSTFKVYLPAVVIQLTELEKTDGQSEKEEGRLKGSGELILVVEDEAAVSSITSSVLEANGYRVLTANDGAEAIPLYEQNKDEIKAVIMDMLLPVMDGPTCINALRKVNAHVKIIAVSGLAENYSLMKQQPSTASVQALLSKPFTSDVLLRTLGKIIQTNKLVDSWPKNVEHFPEWDERS